MSYLKTLDVVVEGENVKGVQRDVPGRVEMLNVRLVVVYNLHSRDAHACLRRLGQSSTGKDVRHLLKERCIELVGRQGLHFLSSHFPELRKTPDDGESFS